MAPLMSDFGTRTIFPSSLMKFPPDGGKYIRRMVSPPISLNGPFSGSLLCGLTSFASTYFQPVQSMPPSSSASSLLQPFGVKFSVCTPPVPSFTRIRSQKFGVPFGAYTYMPIADGFPGISWVSLENPTHAPSVLPPTPEKS